ncbi:hypothetical protein BH23VER1_BH23VER1_14140 [soil metagenome]
MKGDRDDNTYTYSDAMNDWASTQKKSFIRRTRGSLVHPSPDASGFGRVVGYLFRLGVLVLVLGGFWWLSVRSELRSEDFSERFAWVAAEATGAESATFEPFAWKSGDAISSRFSLVGGSTSPFHRIDGQYLRVEDGTWRAFRSQWDLGDLSVDRLSVQLRSGGLGTLPDRLSPAGDEGPAFKAEDFLFRTRPSDPAGGVRDSGARTAPEFGGAPAPAVAGFVPGPGPRFESVTFGDIAATGVDVGWGHSDFTRGRLEGLDATLSRDGERWLVTVKGGTLQQNWWRGLQLVTPMRASIGGGTIRFDDTRFAPDGGAGVITLSGQVTTGQIPELDFVLALESVPIRPLLGAESAFRNHVEGTLDGTATITGSINTRTGVVSRIDGTLSTGVIRRFPAFEALSVITGYDLLRGLPLSGARFALESASGTTTVTNFSLASDDSPIALAGSFSVDPDGSFSGQLDLGVDPTLLDKHPRIRERFFEGRPALGDSRVASWIRIPLEGEFPSLGATLAEQLLAAYQETQKAGLPPR